MSSTRRRFHIRQPVVVDIGCSCRRSKLSSFFFSSSSKQRRTHKYPNVFSPSTASLTTTTTTTTTTTNYTNSSFSPSHVTSSPSQACFSPKQTTKQSTPAASKQAKSGNKKKKKKGVVEESVAVEKESSDPYLDFRDSMLQMIVEKEIYNWDDLRELLQLFLSLNSPYHHHLILQAFAEIWNGVFSPGK